MSKSRKTEKAESGNTNMEFVEKQQVSGRNKEDSGLKQNETENRKKSSGTKQEESGNRKKSSGTKQEESGNRKKSSGTKQEESGNGKESSGINQKESGSRKESSGTKQEESGSRKESSGTKQEENGNSKEEPEKKQVGSRKKKKSSEPEQGSKPANVQNTIESEEKQAKKRQGGSSGRAKRIVLALVIILIIALPAGYIGVAIYYRTHFFPKSTINGIDCGNMTAGEVAPLVDAQINTYCLQVWGRHHATGESRTLVGEVLPEDISLSYIDSLGGVEDILEAQNEWSWLRGWLERCAYGYSLVQGVMFEEDKLKETVSDWAVCRKENMIEPRNAYISDFEEEIGGYRIIPETLSTTLDLDRVLETITNAIYTNQSAVDLEQSLCYLEAEVRQTDAKLTEYVNSANTWLGTEVTYDWNGNEVVLDLDILKEWVVMDSDGPVLDEEAVRDFVKKQARKYNTIGKNKKFLTALGIELTLNSPNYGWKTDIDTETQELTELIYEGRKTEREPAYSVMAREKGNNDIGGDYIEADLTHQHLYVYQNGQIAFETDFVSGKMNIEPSCATPPGIFGLTYKTRNATLRGADYESFVNYWMPFFGNYGMHDATWRRDFGGTIFQDHGSHGCINLPLSAAAVIYEYVSTGFPVICYYYEVDPLGPPDETQMPSEEELLMQEEPGLGQEAQNPVGGTASEPGAEQNPVGGTAPDPGAEQNPGG